MNSAAELGGVAIVVDVNVRASVQMVNMGDIERNLGDKLEIGADGLFTFSYGHALTV